MVSWKAKFYELKKHSKTSAEILATSIFDKLLPDESIAVENVNQTDSDAGNEQKYEISANDNNPNTVNDSLELTGTDYGTTGEAFGIFGTPL